MRVWDSWHRAGRLLGTDLGVEVAFGAVLVDDELSRFISLDATLRELGDLE